MNLLFNFLARGAGAGLSFISLMIYARFVDKDLFGEIAYLLSIIMMIQSLTMMGLPDLIIRNISSNLTIKKNDFLLKLGILQLISILPFAALLLIFTSNNLILLYCIIALVLGNYFLIFLRVYSKIILFNLLTGSLFSLIQIFMVPALIFSYVDSAILHLLVTTSLFLIVSYIFQRRYPIHAVQFNNFNTNATLGYYKKSIHIGLIAFISLLNTSVDVLLLGALTNSTTVADYKVYNFVIFIITFFTLTYTTLLSNKLGEGPIRDTLSVYHSEKYKILVLTTIYAMCTSLMCLFLLPELVFQWTDGKYVLNTFSIIPFVITGAALSFNAFFIVFIIRLDKQGVLVVPFIVSVVVNVMLNIVLIPRYSMLGASMSTAIANILILACNSYVFFMLLKRQRPARKICHL